MLSTNYVVNSTNLRKQSSAGEEMGTVYSSEVENGVRNRNLVSFIV